MKIFIISLLFLFASISHALTVKEAFKKFYNHESISSRHCGKNIHFFLKYLKENNVRYKSGFVASIHEDEVSIPHFDGRWATNKKYPSGESYYLSKWSFHVFVVIDGIAYDFSQREAKTQSLLDYLETSYIPKGETEILSVSGSLNKVKAYTKYLNTKLKVYELDDYAKNFDPTIYEGSFIELFRYAEGDPIISRSTVNNKLDFKSAKEIGSGIWSFTDPFGHEDNHQYPLRADPLPICRGFGFWGSITEGLKYEVSDKREILKVYSFIPSINYKEAETKIFPIGFNKELSDGTIVDQPLFHYASKVVCGDFYSLMKDK